MLSAKNKWRKNFLSIHLPFLEDFTRFSIFLVKKTVMQQGIWRRQETKLSGSSGKLTNEVQAGHSTSFQKMLPPNILLS